MAENEEKQSVGNIVLVTEGGSIPNPHEFRVINAWSISLTLAITCIFMLCLIWPEPYLRILLYLPDGLSYC